MPNPKTLKAAMTQLALTTAQWTSAEYSGMVLYKNQIGLELLGNDLFKIKVGDGIKTWAQLAYGISASLADMTDDSTHRLVTDTEKSTWNGKTTMSAVETYVSGLIGNVYKYKGSVATYAELPTENLTGGDVYNVVAAATVESVDYPAGTNWAWVEAVGEAPAHWDNLGGAFDISSLNIPTASTDLTDTDDIVRFSDTLIIDGGVLD